jgi:type VI protein secretion system component Hcp
MPETSIQTGDVDFILPLDQIAPKLIELVAAGSGQKSGRTSARRTGPAQAPAKPVTPRYSAGTKDGMVPRRN